MRLEKMFSRTQADSGVTAITCFLQTAYTTGYSLYTTPEHTQLIADAQKGLAW